MGKYIGEKIPSSVTYRIPGIGHFLVFEMAGEILNRLVENNGNGIQSIEANVVKLSPK